MIANGLAVEDIRASLGADSLGYISQEGMVEATKQPREILCTACFSGTYPTPLPEADKLGKAVLEAPGSTVPSSKDTTTIETEPQTPATQENSA